MAQTTDTVLMIRPAAFRSNPETAASNAFQDLAAIEDADAQRAALREFDHAVVALRATGVTVCVVEDNPEPQRPDAIFPNNWITTHEDGTVVLYPMQAPSRRAEIRHDVIDALCGRFGLVVARVVDLTPYTADGVYLEGTGSMVFDHAGRVAYACRSPRTDDGVLREICDALGYEPFPFDAVDAGGVPIYHTNVMMWIGTRLAGVCLDSIVDPDTREALRNKLGGTGHAIVEISPAQLGAFAGNMLELESTNGSALLAMSVRAHASLSPSQLAMIETHADPVVIDISTIEDASGGSLRCMLAELFLPTA